jgi:hypothetical protein
MDLLGSLTDLGRKVGAQPVLREEKLSFWEFDLPSGVLREHTKESILLPVAVERSSNAATTPNRYWDFAKYVLDRDSAFWVLARDIVTEERSLARRINALHKLPWKVTSKDAKVVRVKDAKGGKHEVPVNARVVLCLKGRCIAEHPHIQAWLQRQEIVTEGEATCLITGQHASVVRLHPGVQGAKLVSYNEDASRYDRQGRGHSYYPVSAEAAGAYTSALTHLLEEERSLTLAKNTYLAIWPHASKGVTHPIIPIAYRVLGEPPVARDKPEFKTMLERLAKAWEDLEAVPEDNTELRIAILGLRMTRYVPIFYWPTTVTQLRAALLKFRSDFDGFSYRQVSWFWVYKWKCLDNLLYYTLQAVLTGDDYPTRVQQLKDYRIPNSARSLWQRAYKLRRGLPVKDKKGYNPEIEPQEKDYFEATWVKEDPYYNLGRLVALFCQIVRAAQHRNTVHDGPELRYAAFRPLAWFDRSKHAVRNHFRRLDQKNWTGLRVLLERQWEALASHGYTGSEKRGFTWRELDSKKPPTASERNRVSQGYEDQHLYNEHSSAHRKHLRNRGKLPPNKVQNTNNDPADAAE